MLGRALDPGVENVYTWLRGGVLNGEADLDQRWLDGTVEHESMGTRHDNRALAARLADFLQVAYRQYQSTLWKYHRDRLVEVVHSKKKKDAAIVKSFKAWTPRSEAAEKDKLAAILSFAVKRDQK
ncbi:hypothetical protein BASA50_002306 [Batrachochytrium salamandrivorans]|uniref:Uncharacterized protein n=1 Tax=Batrachochytrium salamandrivorans TaxID=1357716 RepID=A0ABQ8FLM7_9FUNG|nr:hypothetical protein BASA50_002306 [Batrachochytrium salamandrivorans]